MSLYRDYEAEVSRSPFSKVFSERAYSPEELASKLRKPIE